MSKNILLIGFMGVGKGSTARKLAKKTGMFAIDTDDLIVSLEKRQIKKIFKKKGEPYFRELEQKCANWLESNVQNTIVSCGGGFYKVNNLPSLGTVVYLKASFEWILKRLSEHPNAKKKFKKRPLFKDRNKAKLLYDSRFELYEKSAHIVVDVERKSIDEVVDEIILKVKEK